MQGADAQAFDQGQEDRGQDDDRGAGFHEHAGDQDDHGDQEHDDELVGGDAQNGCGDGLRDPPVGQGPAEGAGAGDDDHDDRARLGGA